MNEVDFLMRCNFWPFGIFEEEWEKYKTPHETENETENETSEN